MQRWRWRRFWQQRVALFSTALFVCIVASTVVGPLVYTEPVGEIDFSRSLCAPGWQHPFGCNDLGQDVLARVLAGGRISLAVGICSMLITVVIGTAVGTLAGAGGGWLDMLLMRLTDAFFALPLLPLLLLIVFLFREQATRALGAEYGTFALVVVVIGCLSWMPVARLVRAHILTVREMDFVLAARGLGASPFRVVWSHMLPHVTGPVIVAATLSVSWAIVTESTLSFLGLGFPPDTPTWGRMLYTAKDFLDIAPHMAFFPGAAIFLTILSINYIGEGLQDMLAPR